MPSSTSTGVSELEKRLDRVMKAPAGFELFVAIHDFVEGFEAHALFSKLSLPPKYNHLKQVHQGIKDTKSRPEGDLGHSRYMVIQELSHIKEKDVSDSISLWKNREMLRNVSAETYAMLKVLAAK